MGPTNLVDITGNRYGRLVVGSYRLREGWECVCDCGNTTIATGTNLRGGKNLSCGCQRSEVTVARNIAGTKHGCSSTTKRDATSEYGIWAGIKSRCNNSNDSRFKYYGARGIKVCDRWSESFENFMTDMGLRPTNRHTIDRKNVNGNYEPSNCEWATYTVQGRNRRNNTLITFRGDTKCLAEWSEITGYSSFNIIWRIKKGWTVEAALTTPVRPKRRASI